MTDETKGDRIVSGRPEWSKKDAKKPFDYWELSGRSSDFPRRWSPKGFSSKETLLKHVKDHSESVGAKDEKDYVQRAKDFLTAPRGRHGDAFVRKNGDVCRYDYDTHEIATATKDGTIKTYWNLSYGKSADYADNYWGREKLSG